MEKSLEEDLVWRAALDAMLDRGSTQAEAVEAADLIVAAFRRRRAATTAADNDTVPARSRGLTG